MRPNAPIDPKTFAASARQLLLEDRRNYRLFGVYWFLVKALLMRVYPPEEIQLGPYQDPSVIERMPAGVGLSDLLVLATEEYQANAGLNLGRIQVSDPDGELFTLIDPDMGG